MIAFPDEQPNSGIPKPIELTTAQGQSTIDMGMLASRLDINTQQRILLSDGSFNRLLLGYGSGLF
jgi:hypothetical protein